MKRLPRSILATVIINPDQTFFNGRRGRSVSRSITLVTESVIQSAVAVRVPTEMYVGSDFCQII